MNILVADDDTNTRDLLSMILRERGHNVALAHNGFEALQLFESEPPDIAILDVMMPHLDGFGVCERIRKSNPNVAVIFLSAKGDVIDRKTGLRLGADDYLPKPFDEEELILRVEAIARRATRNGQNDNVFVLHRDPFEFDLGKLSLRKRGEVIALTAKEFRILAYLAKHTGETVPADKLIDSIWGNEYRDESISIPVYIRRIRSKIEDDPSKPRYVKTRRGAGYYFEE